MSTRSQSDFPEPAARHGAAGESTVDPGDDCTDDVEAMLAAVAWAPHADVSEVLRALLPDDVRGRLGEDFEPGVPRVGETIAQRYRVEQKIGAGGMGVVFRATQLPTGRTVALKWLTISGRHRSAEERELAFRRFSREAQATARIRHRHVVDVLDASHDPRNPFLVMEHLEGETLRTYLARTGPLSYARVLELVVPVFDAVAEAHRNGVVHRDLKPDNIFMARATDGTIAPKVLDFGVSRLRGDEGGEHALTRTGTVLGTPAYMPLEQLRALADVDERTDVYALGVLVYELLSTKRPFEAKNAADFAAVLACERPTPLVRHRPDLRGAREVAVLRALARAQADRYPDVESFKRALCSARPARSRGAGLFAAALLVAAALGFVFKLGGSPPARTPEVPVARAPQASSVPFSSPDRVRALAGTTDGRATRAEVAGPSAEPPRPRPLKRVAATTPPSAPPSREPALEQRLNALDRPRTHEAVRPSLSLSRSEF